MPVGRICSIRARTRMSSSDLVLVGRYRRAEEAGCLVSIGPGSWLYILFCRMFGSCLDLISYLTKSPWTRQDSAT